MLACALLERGVPGGGDGPAPSVQDGGVSDTEVTEGPGSSEGIHQFGCS